MSEKKLLTPKQTVAISAILTEKSLDDAAKMVGVARRTLERWMADDPTFKEALATAQDACFDSAVRSLTALSSTAINVLADELANDSASVRIKVAFGVLDRLATFVGIRQSDGKIAEFEEMIDRLSQMEKQI